MTEAKQVYEAELKRGGASMNGDAYKKGDIVRGVVNAPWFIILRPDLSWGAWIELSDVTVRKAIGRGE